ncbi:MAG TPA: response regulator transcription factor [Oscillospiraceae bacterium]|jgi:two-component system KDP operon response regulator KdpE|nr:response regulator transcription factor [Oscillospiraceae bacterium]HQQ89933.1 response regulator transcription factor [Oscillospiraceae bacterium]HRW56264.1 response regulator transcription factor [Oscillospiraceae bacterium]
MEQIHILLVEDDPKIVNFMSMALKAKNYKVTTAATGKQGILAFCTQNPDIILLDLGLPDMDGNEIIQEVRKVSEIPILIVSARGMDDDKVAALDLGANDYVTKPFSMTELLARIRVMERFIDRRDLTQPETVLHFGALTIDTERHRIFLDEEEVHLTPLEYKLLVLLAENCGKVVTHSQIMKEVWGYEETGDAKSIRVCMASLRRKIEKDTANPQYIFTEVGIGYRFADK